MVPNAEPHVQPRLAKRIPHVWRLSFRSFRLMYLSVTQAPSLACPRHLRPQVPTAEGWVCSATSLNSPVSSISENGSTALVRPRPGVPLDSSFSSYPHGPASPLGFTSTPKLTAFPHLDETQFSSFAGRAVIIFCRSPCLIARRPHSSQSGLVKT